MALDKEITEIERRRLVKSLAASGTRGQEQRDTSVQTTTDYSAAAADIFAGDPVQLSATAEQSLVDTANEPVESGTRYADAQQAIFDRSRQRSADSNNQYLDDHGTTIEAQQYKLAQYEEDLLKAQQDALSRRGYAGGPTGPPGPPGPQPRADNAFQPTESGFYENSPQLHGPRADVRSFTDDMDYDPYLLQSPQNFRAQDGEDFFNLIAEYPQLYSDANLAVEDYYNKGYSYEDTIKFIGDTLAITMGGADGRAMARWIMSSYEQLWGPQESFADTVFDFRDQRGPQGPVFSPETGTWSTPKQTSFPRPHGPVFSPETGTWSERTPNEQYGGYTSTRSPGGQARPPVHQQDVARAYDSDRAPMRDPRDETPWDYVPPFYPDGNRRPVEETPTRTPEERATYLKLLRMFNRQGPWPDPDARSGGSPR